MNKAWKERVIKCYAQEKVWEMLLSSMGCIAPQQTPLRQEGRSEEQDKRDTKGTEARKDKALIVKKGGDSDGRDHKQVMQRSSHRPIKRGKG